MQAPHPDPTSDARPLVTFALFTYNQEKYIRHALEGAFAQTYQPLEIILTDDYSTDTTFAIMQQMVADYAGPHTVRLRRPDRNRGLAGGISDVSAMAAGSLIVGAAGDDISMPERTARLVDAWRENGYRSGSLYSHFVTIDDDGTPLPPQERCKGWAANLADRQLFMLNNFSGLSGCTHAWTKDVFDIFGPIDSRIDHEDIAIPLRSLMIGYIVFVPHDLVSYRLAPGSITRRTYANTDERIGKMLKYWQRRKFIFDQFHQDTRHAYVGENTNAADLDWLIGETRKAETYATTMVKLYSGSRVSRFATALTPTAPLAPRERLKWLIIAAVPSVYGMI